MLMFYVLFYIENWVMFGLWIAETKYVSEWFYPASIAAVACGMVFHIIFQILYYKVCHPNSDTISWCEPLSTTGCFYSDGQKNRYIV